MKQLQSRAYYNFINSIRSEHTRKKYHLHIQDFMKFTKINDPTLLLEDREGTIEKSIIDYIVSLKKKCLSFSTINTRTSAIYHFYLMNDVILNTKKINKYKGEFQRVVKDRAYTIEEISKLLQIADLRMKVCILLMASAGLRLGAIPDLKIKGLISVAHLISGAQGVQKLTVYENTKDEYYTFCTPECSHFIDEYINYRGLNGENVTSEAYLIREQFDVSDPIAAKHSRQVSRHTIRQLINNLLVRSGIRKVDGNRKEVAMTHGFRKFFNTTLLNAEVNQIVKEKLMGHSVGLDDSYYRPSEKKMLEEYKKAINDLTINEEHRLRTENQELKQKYERLDHVLARINIMEKKLGIS